MNISSPRMSSLGIVHSDSRILTNINNNNNKQSKMSFENMPIYVLQQKNQNTFSNRIDKPNNPYSNINSMKGSSCFTTPRQSLSNLNPFDFLHNVDQKKNSIKISHQSQSVKLAQAKNHQKNNSLMSLPQNQMGLSKSSSNKSINPNYIEQNDQSIMSNLGQQKENNNLYEAIQKLQSREKELMKTIEQLQQNVHECKQKINSMKQDNLNLINSTSQQLLQTQIEQHQDYIQKLQTKVKEKEDQIAQLYQQSNNNSLNNEQQDTVKRERDELRENMKEIIEKIESVLLENQQLTIQTKECTQLNNILQQQLASKEQEISHLKTNLENQQEKFNIEIKQMNDHNISLSQEIQTNKSANKSQIINDEIENKMKQAAQQNDTLSYQLRHIINQRNNLQINSQKLLDQNECLYTKINRLNEHISKLDQENKQLSNLNEQFRDQENINHNDLQMQIDDLELRILDLINENQSLNLILEQQQKYI